MAAREAYSLYVERAAEGANEADGPLSSLSPGELAQRLSGDPCEDPLLAQARAEALVEADGGAVPVEHRPLHAAAAARDRDLGKRAQQRLAGAPAALRGANEQVFEVEARAAQK